MKYRIPDEYQNKIDQFARSNYADLLLDILRGREKQLNDLFRSTLPESFQQVQGRALEIESLIVALKIKEREA